MADGGLDVALLPWIRRSTDAWTTQATRARVLTWVRAYVAQRSWTQKPPDGPGWSVVERFSDRGLDSRVQTTPPYQPTSDAPFYQRSGDRLLLVRIECRGASLFLEHALTFPQGNETSSVEITRILDQASASLDAEHRRLTT